MRTRGGCGRADLLVVVLMLTLRVGLLVPAIQAVRAAADKASCQTTSRALA